jgi:hypothetical protein
MLGDLHSPQEAQLDFKFRSNDKTSNIMSKDGKDGKDGKEGKTRILLSRNKTKQLDSFMGNPNVYDVTMI